MPALVGGPIPAPPPVEAANEAARDSVAGMWIAVVAILSTLVSFAFGAVAAFMVSGVAGMTVVALELLAVGVACGVAAVRLLLHGTGGST